MVAEPLARRPLDDLRFSLYLDLCRFTAALAVLLGHMYQDGYAMNAVWERLSHEAVIVFFVVSGLVIAHSAEGRDWRAYLAARSSRLYAVIIPAALFSISCAALIGPEGWRPGVVERAEWDFADIGLSLLFLSRSWLIDADLPLNYPFWSLCYEAFYYLMFALALYGGRFRWLWVGVAAIVAGPAILALMPAWLAGLWLHHRSTDQSWRMPTAIAILTIGLIFAICLTGLPDLVRHAVQDRFPIWYAMRDSTPFFTDMLIAALFTAHLIAMRHVGPKSLLKFEKPIRTLSGATFTLYLFHRPVLLLLSGEEFGFLHGPLGAVVMIATLVGGAVFLSKLLEGTVTRWLRGTVKTLLAPKSVMTT